MARKTIPAHPTRERSRDDESLLLRSAESLGRMIGSLQRQLDVAIGREPSSKPDGRGRPDGQGNSNGKRSVKAKSGASSSRGGASKRSGAGNSNARKSAKKR
jgi:hypothetical protein